MIKGSEHYAIFALASAKLIMEDVEISDSNTSGLVLGHRSLGAATAELKSCRFLQNGLGMGVFGGSFASLEGCEFRGNEDGIIVLDQGSRLKGNKLTLAANKDCGINVRSSAQAIVTDSDIQGNARGAVSGTRGKAAERGSLTLEDCRFAGNRTFAAGACAQSELILTRCVFDGSEKTNVYKERGAVVQNDAIPQPAPVPQPTASRDPEKPVPAPEVGDDSSLPNEQTEVTPSPESTTSPHHEKSSPKPRRKPTPRPRPPTPEDVHRLLRRLLPGG
ncbi:MAG: right-handed parallel beta-helix repeat-containing protein [Chthoniobacterales bacterium]|nr:right-handed parallel beta-helix repeat-containing protein [Chthoniobacterales bacterium]